MFTLESINGPCSHKCCLHQLAYDKRPSELAGFCSFPQVFHGLVRTQRQRREEENIKFLIVVFLPTYSDVFLRSLP